MVKNMVKNVNVVIIGCSSGLGKHLALAYGKYQNVYENDNQDGEDKEFLNILLVSRRKSLLEELKNKLDRTDRKIETYVQDITKEDAPQNIFEYWNSKFDSEKIDHLICNAGILVKASPKDINLTKNKETWDKLYKTNYLSHRKIIEFALGKDEKKKTLFLKEKASVAITSSSEGKRYFPTPNNYFGAYGKSKKMMEKWVTNTLRKDDVVKENKINVTVMYPSKIDGPMFFHILEKDGKRTKRKPEWDILGFKEPHKKFDDYNMDVLALRYYLAIQNNKKEEYSSLVDRIIIKYLPEPFSFFFFYSIGLTKNLSLVDIPIYLLLQFPFEIPILLKMIINNFYIKDNRITKKDIKESEYKLNKNNIKDDENLLYRYYIFNTIVLSGIGYYVDKKVNGSKITNKIFDFFRNFRIKQGRMDDVEG